jgi:putative spermidine/putrescine transport system ATP-binding protein
VERIVHRFGPALALDDISLDIDAGELVALLGPSGCGKTTLLRVIAGFLRPDRGDVRIGGAAMTRVPPGQRGVGIMFQSYALFPHMTVEENIAYGLQAHRRPRAQVAAQVDRMLALVQLHALRDRYPRQLSGGQQQRVALARALALEPHVLLLDEPFAALDTNLRLDMQIEIRRLQQQLGITAILVTHDQSEAMSMADRIAIMRHGRVEQFARPVEVYDRPASLFVNQFIGASNVLCGDIVGGDAAHCLVRIGAAGPITLARSQTTPPSGPVLVSLRPENLRIAAPGSAHALHGQVRMMLPLGALSIFEIMLADGQTVKLTELRTAGAASPRAGESIALELVSAEGASLFARPAP